MGLAAAAGPAAIPGAAGSGSPPGGWEANRCAVIRTSSCATSAPRPARSGSSRPDGPPAADGCPSDGVRRRAPPAGKSVLDPELLLVAAVGTALAREGAGRRGVPSRAAQHRTDE